MVSTLIPLSHWMPTQSFRCVEDFLSAITHFQQIPLACQGANPGATHRICRGGKFLAYSELGYDL